MENDFEGRKEEAWQHWREVGVGRPVAESHVGSSETANAGS